MQCSQYAPAVGRLPLRSLYLPYFTGTLSGAVARAGCHAVIGGPNYVTTALNRKVHVGAVAVAAAVQGEEAQQNGQLLQIPPMGTFQAAAPAAAPPPPSTTDIVAMLQQVLRGQHELRAISENVPRRMRNSRVADGAAVLRPLCRERVRHLLAPAISIIHHSALRLHRTACRTVSGRRQSKADRYCSTECADHAMHLNSVIALINRPVYISQMPC